MSDPILLSTSDFTIPETLADGIFKKAQGTSVLARLCAAEPQKFGTTEHMILTGSPKAELVGEGVAKSPSEITVDYKPVVPLKFQTTIRLNEEVKWADEDHQLAILETAFEEIGISLGRALDLAAIHKINPYTGAVAAQISEGITDTTNVAVLDDDAYTKAVETAAKAIIDDGYVPSMIAFEPGFSFGLATEKDADGYNLYPGMGFGLNVENFLGMRASVSDTVSGKKDLATPGHILAIIGQADAFKWGVQREIRAHMIEFGDPDGQGDLKRYNQIAIRAEVVYGIGIMDKDAFAKIVDEDSDTDTDTE